jgi:hypothetical protein
MNKSVKEQCIFLIVEFLLKMYSENYKCQKDPFEELENSMKIQKKSCLLLALIEEI